MKYILLIQLFVFTVQAQETIFESSIKFSDIELSNFFSSITQDENKIYFCANDYSMYAINKATKEIVWKHELAWKSNLKPFVYDSIVIFGKHSVLYDANTGEIKTELPLNTFLTEPFIKESVLYATAIDDEIYGSIFAYDLVNDSILWKRFIAHGVEKRPIYLNDRIIANAEGDNWFDLSYDGVLLDTACKEKATIFVDNIPCVRNMKFLTYYGYEIDHDFISKNFIFDNDVLSFTDSDKTILYGYRRILVLNSGKRIKLRLDLEKMFPEIQVNENDYTEILLVNDDTLWFIYENHMIAYDISAKKTLKQYDLSLSNPHQVLLDLKNNQLWLISKNDGQLYGISL